MTKKEIVSLLTDSLNSLRREGKFARVMLWKHARAVIFFGIFQEAHSFMAKIIRIALIGIFLSFFQEDTLIKVIKDNWPLALGVFIAYSLLGKVVSVFSTVARERCEGILSQELKSMIWLKSQSVGIGTRVSSSFRKKLRTARRCTHYDVKNVGLWPIEALSAIFSCAVLISTLAWLNWRIGTVFLLIASIVSTVGVYMARWVREKEKSLQEDEDKANEYGPASLSVDSTLRGIGHLLFATAQKLNRRILEEKMAFTRRAMLVTTIVGSITLIAVALQLYLIRETLFKNLTLVQLGVTVSTMAMAIGSFTETMRLLFGDQHSIADIREFQEFLIFPDSEVDKNDASFYMDGLNTIQVAHVGFAYPYIENSPRVLQDVTLEFFPGEAVALVGANGSGKTTLANILSNIFRPDLGYVSYGNVTIGDYTTRSVLEHTLVIPQSGYIDDLPLCESLFGTADMMDLDAGRYFKAIQMSGARDVLDHLPNGIHTQIGTGYTGGTDLSGGEKQRLRLAAFFYIALHPSKRVIIADEPSRYLDPATRVRVYKELIALASDLGKIVIVISHDAELGNFDRAIVMEQGRVAKDCRGEDIKQVVHYVSKKLADDTVYAD